MAFEKDPSEIGCLWEKEGRRGKYFTGQVNGQGIVVFATNAKSSKAPQWRILIAKPKDEAVDIRRPDDTEDF